MLVAGCVLALAACNGGSGSGEPLSAPTSNVTISVVLASNPPSKAALDAFTKETGITVKWTNVDWDSLQTKITAAVAAKTYFADATNVDWSRVGQLGKLNAFYPMEQLMDTAAMAADVPQLTSFTAGGHVVGIPYDASFSVTTINKNIYDKAGVAVPTTMDEYTQGLKAIKANGAVQYPLNIPFAAAEGLSTYWYQTTGAFGGTVLDDKYKPTFTDPGSPGYKAAQWMVDAVKQGLVPPGNINVSDTQGQQTLMAKGEVASTFSDYSGMIGSLYDDPASSSVVQQVRYLRTPGAAGPGPNNSNPDGVGVPRTAKYPKAAAIFIKWFTSAENQADWAGINGVDKAIKGYPLPSHVSAVEQLASKGQLIGGKELAEMLKTSSRPIFPGGAPSWYPEFSRTVYTSLHSAAAGEMTVDAAIKAIADTANRLSAGG
ncbi:sugar ABC transporter substrate-binding protein [Virgisporangium aliadipatigenens]|uniref:Sugar ABC transporter substrate-binding protein n=1 Tax=Virgisporangium aliadipatigenens TaxID=741659 RepID=A0A8J4DW99_9ACTN|nr:extracellular solute-binding protein [Virgisporangium aliadipatigenens]GIJ50922.1 sugar ABC transporter substrate-binding protein [Virgisporangium aliadipatigenens]